MREITLRFNHWMNNDARRRAAPLTWQWGQWLLRRLGKPPADDAIIYARLLVGQRMRCKVCRTEYWSKRSQKVCDNLDCWRAYEHV